MPPYLFDLRVADAGKDPMHVWIPVFLLWPLGLVLVVLVLAVTVIVDLVLLVAGQRYHHYSQFVLGCLDLLSQARGLTTYVHGERTTVDLTIL